MNILPNKQTEAHFFSPASTTAIGKGDDFVGY